eukprot:GGOE01054840.1.p1 GENE.GGOE01054840.1~~GGOE01054840.1.p1  ORF type:complete len:350 (+),score=106.26 GGOE01054840.1:65-1114(+)
MTPPSSDRSLSTARLMLPDDANPAGNVHGGTILKLIEQAGHIVATRFCNRTEEGAPPRPPTVTVTVGALAQIHSMTFLLPMYVGEVAKLYARPTFTSNRSVEVEVDVWAENVVTGSVRQTNHAILCYVAVDPQTGPVDFTIPQLTPSGPEEEQLFAAGLQRYLQRKEQLSGGDLRTPLSPIRLGTFKETLPPASASPVSLVQVMLPGDCHYDRVVGGGVIMKLMDNAAGICATKHCKSNVVTVSIDTLTFHGHVQLADIAHIRARLVFTSAKSMDILVEVEVERFSQGEIQLLGTTAGIFTFVSLDAKHQAQAVPPFVPSTPEDAALFEQRHLKYQERRAKAQKRPEPK